MKNKHTAEPTEAFWITESVKCFEDEWYFYYWYFETNFPKMNREQYYKKRKELTDYFSKNLK